MEEAGLKPCSSNPQVGAFNFYTKLFTVSDAVVFILYITINTGFLGLEWIHFIIVWLLAFSSAITL